MLAWIRTALFILSYAALIFGGGRVAYAQNAFPGGPQIPSGGGFGVVLPPLPLNPTPSSLTPGFLITQSFDGTPSVGTPGNPNFWGNFISIASDDAAVGGSFASAFTIMHNFGGSKMTGGRNTFSSYCIFTAQSNSSNTNRNYTCGLFDAHATATEGGTNNTTGAQGALFGFNPQAILLNNATNWLEVTSGEHDFAAQAGSSVRYKFGLSIIELASDAVAAGTSEAMLQMSGQTGAVGVSTGILFTNSNGQFPLTTSGTLLSLAGSPTFTNGVDIHAATISGFAWQSPNFTIAGNGLTNLAAAGSTGAPVLAFTGCGTNCGFVAPASSQFELVVGGAAIWDANVTTSSRFTFHERVDLAGNILSGVGQGASTNASGWQLGASNASSTVPTLIPNASSTTTGFGAQASGNISAIVASTEVARFIAGGLNLPTAATGTPTASLCLDASNNVIKKTTTGSCI